MNESGDRAGNILVVDDDREMRHFISSILKRRGFEITLAATGVEALKYLETATPNVILSDVMMPDMDGLTFLKILRSQPATSNIPVILLTALGETESIVTGLSLGADDYIKKPFMPSELLARIQSKITRPPVPSEMIARDVRTGLLKPKLFQDLIVKERFRSMSNGSEGFLAYLSLSELPILRERMGIGVEAEIWRQAATILEAGLRPSDMIGWGRESFLGLLLPDTSELTAHSILSSFAVKIINHTFIVGDEQVHLTPSFGFSNILSPQTAEELNDQALTALDLAARNLDLQPIRYDHKMGSVAKRKKSGEPSSLRHWFARAQKILILPWQILLTIIIGIILPYFIYAWLDSIGYDVTSLAYIIVTVALVITAFLIWLEGFLAMRAAEPPLQPETPYPTASAIIAAYLPNEAPTILETVQAFLQIEYPAPLQIILAYNTPHDLPIEKNLQEIARRDPRFKLYRVEQSSSKAQNVNKALTIAEGEFVGIFDADHHPKPDGFTRAWRWLSHGTDVVQGHCVVRNGNASWVARLVAVEFEAIYAVSHPGRSILHNFGIFGGSNGYWKTDLLRKTRMHGFMLTEDIDSSIRIMTAGAKIKSDPKLISRELAPTNLKALWNQRLRWAQGWHQVSIKHLMKALLSKNLSLRQKVGALWLLGWREVYPWISLQMFPIIFYWIVKYGGVEKIDWLIPIFVMTTAFTLSVAPGQAYFAYKLSDPEIRKHTGWFFYYLIVAAVFYTEYKNVIARVAQIKELFKEHHWKVTPRTAPKKI
jgi:cellulose synthase/poly-beta-1,6-N-acetylglucosamine synthase-like glycosyltransferase/CheY-like chemotaxis protein